MEPKQFGNYTLMQRVSHGGMAEVFRAKSFGEAGFEREVALKLLLPQMASDKEFVDMLIDEAKIAGQLNHANIAQIFDLGEVDGRYYIVQEFVQGQDLREVLKRKSRTRTKLRLSNACHIAIKVCEGLHYAHNKRDPMGRRLNLVHRDISPHNILISNEGEVKIIDFGIAKAEGRSTQTMAGLVKGKFAYMSPEQIRGLPVDHRSDVFATGILLHEMLTSRPLFQSSTEFETLKKARAAHAEPPSIYNAEVPPALDVICLKALARHVDDRYQSAGEMRDELWAFARANNAFAVHEQLSNMNPNAPQSEEHVQIQIASELDSESEELLVVRASTSLDAEEPRHEALVSQGEALSVGDEEELTVVGPECTLPAEAYIVGEDSMGASLADDYADDAEENRTVVDANIADLLPGMGDADAHDSDARWAADVGGPLSGASSRSLPQQGVHNRAPTNTEEETTAIGASLAERPTNQFGVPAAPLGLPGQSRDSSGRDRRASTVPATPARAAARTASPRQAVEQEPRGKMALAQTEPISKELLARAVNSTPTGLAPNVGQANVAPADVVRGRATARVDVPRTPSPSTPQPQAARPSAQVQAPRPPAQAPRPPAQAPRPSAQVPRPSAQVQQGQGGMHSQASPPPSQYGSAPMPMPGANPLPQQFGSEAGPLPGPSPQNYVGSAQSGSRPVQMPQAFGVPSGPPIQQSSEQLALGSPPPPSGQTVSGAEPLTTNASGAVSRQGGPQPLQIHQGVRPAANTGAQGRMVFVLSALFILMLAAAATLTLVITG